MRDSACPSRLLAAAWNHPLVFVSRVRAAAVTPLSTGSETTSAYLTVQNVDSDQSAICVVQNTCKLEGVQLTVHIGNMKNSAAILSETDKEALLAYGKPNKIDFVALSFTRNAQDVKDARAYMDK